MALGMFLLNRIFGCSSTDWLWNLNPTSEVFLIRQWMNIVSLQSSQHECQAALHAAPIEGHSNFLAFGNCNPLKSHYSPPRPQPILSHSAISTLRRNHTKVLIPFRLKVMPFGNFLCTITKRIVLSRVFAMLRSSVGLIGRWPIWVMSLVCVCFSNLTT